MTDRVLVEALCARDPDALTALYDAYAEDLYRYCWSLLLSADGAQVALRDTLIAAEAHAAALADPDRLRTWLYALARAECLRRRVAAPPGVAEALATAPPLDDPGDADLRVIAWNAVQGLPPADREILELSIRHELPDAELAQVLAVPARQVEPAMAAARDRLRDAVTAEILARKGPYDCPRRAAILSGFSGELTAELRERLVGHLSQCEICAPHRGRQVAAARVFELLPPAEPPDSLRIRVLSCFTDPELLPYRRYVARRTSVLDAAGFPVPTDKNARRWPQALAGALAAVAAVVAIVLIFDRSGGEEGGLSGLATAAFPPSGEPPLLRLPWHREPREVPLTVNSIAAARSPATGPPPGTTGAPPPRPLSSAAIPLPTGRSTQTPPAGDPPAGDPPAKPPSESPPPATHSAPIPRPGTRTPCPTRSPRPTRTPTPTPTPTHTPTQTTAPTQTVTPTPTGEPPRDGGSPSSPGRRE